MNPSFRFYPKIACKDGIIAKVRKNRKCHLREYIALHFDGLQKLTRSRGSIILQFQLAWVIEFSGLFPYLSCCKTR